MKSNTATVEYLQYALSLPTSVVITGIDGQNILDQVLQVAGNFKPLNPQIAAILSKTAQAAAKGEKPNVTRAAAREYGYPFEYRSRPEWITYANFLDFARVLRRDLRDLRVAAVNFAKPTPSGSVQLGGGMSTMETKDKCAHPSCHCPAKEGSKYCSTYCEGEGETADILCNCGHSGCGDK